MMVWCNQGEIKKKNKEQRVNLKNKYKNIKTKVG